jgi:hypothetical protein
MIPRESMQEIVQLMMLAQAALCRGAGLARFRKTLAPMA